MLWPLILNQYESFQESKSIYKIIISIRKKKSFMGITFFIFLGLFVHTLDYANVKALSTQKKRCQLKIDSAYIF